MANPADSVTNYVYDTTDIADWTWYGDTYTLGKQDYELRWYDDGHFTYTNIDNTSSEVWESYINTYDVQGRLDYQLVYWDGVHEVSMTDYDQRSSEPWQSYTVGYDWVTSHTNPGTVVYLTDYQWVSYDDGTTHLIDWDQRDLEDWSSYQNVYDSADRLDYQWARYDDGATTLIDWDQSGTESWTAYENFYDDSGALTDQYVWWDTGISGFLA